MSEKLTLVEEWGKEAVFFFFFFGLEAASHPASETVSKIQFEANFLPLVYYYNDDSNILAGCKKTLTGVMAMACSGV